MVNCQPLISLSSSQLIGPHVVPADVVHRYKKNDDGEPLDLYSKADNPLIGHYSRPKVTFLVVLDLKRHSNALPIGLNFDLNQ